MIAALCHVLEVVREEGGIVADRIATCFTEQYNQQIYVEGTGIVKGLIWIIFVSLLSSI